MYQLCEVRTIIALIFQMEILCLEMLNVTPQEIIWVVSGRTGMLKSDLYLRSLMWVNCLLRWVFLELCTKPLWQTEFGLFQLKFWALGRGMFRFFKTYVLTGITGSSLFIKGLVWDAFDSIQSSWTDLLPVTFLLYPFQTNIS